MSYFCLAFVFAGVPSQGKFYYLVQAGRQKNWVWANPSSGMIDWIITTLNIWLHKNSTKLHKTESSLVLLKKKKAIVKKYQFSQENDAVL